MLISPINYNSYHSNKIQPNIKTQTVNFQGHKNLQAINLNSLKNDSTKLLYGKILRGFVKKSGIVAEKSEYYRLILYKCDFCIK